MDAEQARLQEAQAGTVNWYLWGPYLSDRQWGTVREDYSADGDAWAYFPHGDARSRAFRWGEDGLFGLTDEGCRLCFALACWNEADPILKERLFGLTGPEGNHGEDVKELYHYVDATPTASYLRAIYRYPQRAFPYEQLLQEARKRSRFEPEYELVDTGVFDEDRRFDIEVEYAKSGYADIRIRIRATNRGPVPAPLHLLPTLWFRNTWAWGRDQRRPEIRLMRQRGGSPDPDETEGAIAFRAVHPELGCYWLTANGRPSPLVTENETNAERLWGVPSRTRAVKDAFHAAIVEGDRSRLVDRECGGTKVAAHYRWVLPPGGSRVALLRLALGPEPRDPNAGAAATFSRRKAEAEAFYRAVGRSTLSAEERWVQREALAGLIWNKQFYCYDVGQWLDGDPPGPTPPAERHTGRNADWREFNSADVLSVPDKWEFPWFAAWDLAFHCIPLALIDPDFAKRQLVLLTRVWYMHPNGQLPACEWSFSDVNPPVHAWAAWRVYEIDRHRTGRADRAFLERVFHKLLLNFTWWVNRKDREGRNVFQGGFLGLDNIGIFDRNAELPQGGQRAQADGTAWMGFYSLTMMTIALELARDDPVYEDIATKFFEHFLYIAGALNDIGGAGIPLWNDEDGFFYDVLSLPDHSKLQLRIRSLVGLIPLLAVETIEPDLLTRLPAFAERMQWFLDNRPHLAALVSRWQEPGAGQRRLLALVRGHRMKLLLHRLLDPDEFLSPYGIRSLSRWHLDHPYRLAVGREFHEVRYEPAESSGTMFGGNSNWRGPIWFPINYLLIEALRRFHHYYGDEFLVECPTGSGVRLTLLQVADELARRLIAIFLPDTFGHRPLLGPDPRMQVLGREHLLFHECFNGDTGAGLGASHQTGWTALVAMLLNDHPAGNLPVSSAGSNSPSTGCR